MVGSVWRGSVVGGAPGCHADALGGGARKGAEPSGRGLSRSCVVNARASECAGGGEIAWRGMQLGRGGLERFGGVPNGGGTQGRRSVGP